MMAHFFVSGSATTYWIDHVRGSKKPVTSGLAVMEFSSGSFRVRQAAHHQINLIVFFCKYYFAIKWRSLGKPVRPGAPDQTPAIPGHQSQWTYRVLSVQCRYPQLKQCFSGPWRILPQRMQ